MARNKLGQITSNRKSVEIAIQKYLEKDAKEIDMKIKPIIRDELEQTLRAEIYASYTPATEKGKATQEYNKTHKHQKPNLYHHTGILAGSIHGRINENSVEAGPMEGVKYPNGKSAQEIYTYLKFGTTDTPKKDVYSYDNGTKFSRYSAQEPHNFEARTREYMKVFLKKLAQDIESKKNF